MRFDEATAHGDRFPYQTNYVAREPDEVASHFGAPMQKALFALEPSDAIWRGPFQSRFGFHLVMLTRSEPGVSPPFESLRAKVEEAAVRASAEARFGDSIESIVRAYRVRVNSDGLKNLPRREIAQSPP